MKKIAQWELVVALAREVDENCARGTVDEMTVARLARAVIDFPPGLLSRLLAAAANENMGDRTGTAAD